MLATKSYNISLTERDESILFFLWNYKLATTALIWFRFFQNSHSPSACYQRMQKLMHSGYIEKRVNRKGQKPVWVLSKQGFELVLLRLPELRAEGFKSEHFEHDLYVTLFHLGDLIYCPNPELISVTEQMLRRYQKDLIPSVIPDPDEHMPDGYWLSTVATKIKLTAIEVELNKKSPIRYRPYFRFYKTHTSISQVFWVVPNRSMAKGLYSMSTSEDSKTNNHNFILLSDFLRLGWGARIILGPYANSSVREAISNIHLSKLLASPEHFQTLLIANTHLYPRNLLKKQNLEKINFKASNDNESNDSQT